MLEFYNELQSGNGPVFLQLNHLHENTIEEIESILHKVERPTRGLFQKGRGTDYRNELIEMHISEIGFCSGHSASGVFVDEFARTTVPGLYAAGDMASVPHNYMLGAFTNGSVAGEHASELCGQDSISRTIDAGRYRRERERVLAPTKRDDGIPPEPDRIQDAPAGERLSTTAEGAHASIELASKHASPKSARILEQR